MAQSKAACARRLSIGREGEEQAARYLQQQGLEILARNLRTRYGELDIVAREGRTLVIVEVRTVTRAHFLGHPAASITLSKARQVLRATRHYLATLGQRGRRTDVRIDAIGIELSTGRIEHLPGAIRWDMERAPARPRRRRGLWP